MIKETNENSPSESSDKKLTNQAESNELSSNSKNRINISSAFNQKNPSIKDMNNLFVNSKPFDSNLKIELEDNQNNSNNINNTKEKENSTLKDLDNIEGKINNMNNMKTPDIHQQQYSPMNYQLKKNGNFQKKFRKNTYTKNDFDKLYINQVKSPVYSYFGQSQKFLSEKYSRDSYLNSSERKNDRNEENIDNQGSNNFIIKDKGINSDEHDIEKINYNDFNLFTDSYMSPDLKNSSHISGGPNILNKYSNKLSRATDSFKRGNNSGVIGENGNIDFNMDTPMNESNDEYSNNFMNINSNNLNSINNEDINSFNNIINNEVFPNNNNKLILDNLNNNLSINNNNLMNENDNFLNQIKLNQIKSFNFSNNNINHNRNLMSIINNQNNNRDINLIENQMMNNLNNLMKKLNVNESNNIINQNNLNNLNTYDINDLKLKLLSIIYKARIKIYLYQYKIISKCSLINSIIY